MDVSSFKMYDGTFLPDYTLQANGSSAAVLCIHGITSEIDILAAFGKMVHEQLNYDVHIPILRGYHDSQRKGDVSSMVQYELDIESMLKNLRSRYEKIYLLGHSIGSGSIFRYIQENNSSLFEHAVLTAPFLHPGHNIFEQGGGNDGDYQISFKKALLAGFLNRTGLTFLDGTSIAEIPRREFPLDPASAVKKHQLTYRLMLSRFMKDDADFDNVNYHKISFITGEHDEIINAARAAEFFTQNTPSPLRIIANEDHNTILTSSQLLHHFQTI